MGAPKAGRTTVMMNTEKAKKESGQNHSGEEEIKLKTRQGKEGAELQGLGRNNSLSKAKKGSRKNKSDYKETKQGSPIGSRPSLLKP